MAKGNGKYGSTGAPVPLVSARWNLKNSRRNVLVRSVLHPSFPRVLGWAPFLPHRLQSSGDLILNFRAWKGELPRAENQAALIWNRFQAVNHLYWSVTSTQGFRTRHTLSSQYRYVCRNIEISFSCYNYDLIWYLLSTKLDYSKWWFKPKWGEFYFENFIFGKF